MKTSHIFTGWAAALGMAAATAAPATINATIPNGRTAFDNTVTTAGGTVHTQSLSGMSAGTSWTFTDFTVASTNGATLQIDSMALPSGQSFVLDPSLPVSSSGVTFTFNTAINAFGLEVEGWASCCTPSSLYVSFDGGATLQVATASSANDNPSYAIDGTFLNFVAGFDTSSTFTSVTFYADGLGDYVQAGGTVRYATLPLGSVVPTSSVPEPETYALMLAGLAAMTALRRRRASV